MSDHHHPTLPPHSTRMNMRVPFPLIPILNSGDLRSVPFPPPIVLAARCLLGVVPCFTEVLQDLHADRRQDTL